MDPKQDRSPFWTSHASIIRSYSVDDFIAMMLSGNLDVDRYQWYKPKNQRNKLSVESITQRARFVVFFGGMD